MLCWPQAVHTASMRGAKSVRQRLIERFEPELLQRYGARLLPSQLKALAAIKRCRTDFAPRMLVECTGCGQQSVVPHSCGHRSCPHCQHHEAQVWLERQLRWWSQARARNCAGSVNVTMK